MYKHVHVLNICINGLTNNCTKNGHCNKSLCIYTYIGFLKNLGKGISNSNLSSRKYIFFLIQSDVYQVKIMESTL